MLNVKLYKHKTAETQGRITLGDYSPTDHEIRIFLTPLKERTEILCEETGLDFDLVFNDLFSLVVYHELHHATFRYKSTEKGADVFAIKQFRRNFGRKACIEKHWMTKLPS